MLKIADVIAREVGELVPEFQGNIEKTWEYYHDTNEHGPWAFQDIVVSDDSGAKIRVKISNRIKVPADAVALYLKCGPDKKGKLKGIEVGENDKHEKRIETKGWSEVMIHIDGDWKVLERLKEQEAPAAGAPPPPGVAKTPPAPGSPAASGPAAPGAAALAPAKTETPGPKEPVKTGPTPIEPDTRTLKEKALSMPVKDLAIIKQCAEKSAASIVEVLIQAGWFDLKDKVKAEKEITDTIERIAGKINNGCFEIGENIPF